MRKGEDEADVGQRVADRDEARSAGASGPRDVGRPSRPTGVITVLSTETTEHGEIVVTAVDALGHALRVSSFRSVRPTVRGPSQEHELRFMTIGPRGTSGPSVSLTLGEAEELVARLGDIVARLREAG